VLDAQTLCRPVLGAKGTDEQSAFPPPHRTRTHAHTHTHTHHRTRTRTRTTQT
jgi:hypothetical protein